MRTMYDAITPTNIPANAEMVAGYLDGRYMWKAEHWARFPGAVKIQIACFATTNGGHVLDVEWGDSTPAEAPGWIRRRQAAGLARPTIYCNRSTLPAVQAACAGLTWDLWLADYTQQPHLDSRSVATQYADPGPVDLSLVSDDWYPATPKGEDVTGSEKLAWIIIAKAVAGHVVNQADYDAYFPIFKDDASNVQDVVWKIFTEQGGPDWLAKSGQPGQPGKDGPKGDPGPASTTVAVHSHDVTATTGEPK